MTAKELETLILEARLTRMSEKEADLLGLENIHGGMSRSGSTLAKTEKLAIAWIKRLEKDPHVARCEWAVWPVSHYSTGETIGYACTSL